MATFDSLLSQLKAHIDCGNTGEGQTVLHQLKLWNVQNAATPAQSAALYEAAVLFSCADCDLDGLSRHMTQLMPYLAHSSNPNLFRGLHLLSLLVTHRSSEFHSELELLTPAQAQDPLIQFPITLERQLVVGMYDQITQSEPQYQWLVDLLMNETVRETIADCLEVAYESLSVKDACRLLNVSELPADREDWIVEGDRLVFRTGDAGDAEFPSQEYIPKLLTYATELEKII